MLNIGAVERDHHEHAGQEDGAAHSLGACGELSNGFGVAAGEEGYRIELFERFRTQKLWPEHVGDHCIAKAPGKIEELSEQHAPGTDHIENEIDMQVRTVHGHQKNCKGRQDNDPIGVGYTSYKQDSIGDEAHVDPPFDELLVRLQMDKVAYSHENAEPCYRVVDFAQNHVGMIGDGIQQSQIAEVGAVQHIRQAKSHTISRTGNQNAKDQDRRYRENTVADNLPNILLTEQEQRQEDEKGKKFQRNGEHEVDDKALVIVLHPAGDSQNGKVKRCDIVGTENHDGGHKQVGGIEENAGKKCVLLG